MLYDPARHDKLEAHAFDEDQVQRTIQKIIEDTVDVVRGADTLWPAHPKDHFEGGPSFFTDFYMGAAGTAWALNELSAQYGHQLQEFAKNKIEHILSAHIQSAASDPGTDKGSYFVGEAGIRAVLEKLSPNIENKNELGKLIQSKLNSDQNELLYGLPGALLLAHHLFGSENSGLIDEMRDRLLSTRTLDAPSGAQVWTQNLGKSVHYLGAAHGSVGNYALILRTLPAHEQEKRWDIISNLEKILKTYARIENESCNWPTILDLKPDTKVLVHWCHGATGVVTDLAAHIRKEESAIIDGLLLKAGHLIWHAGPLKKGVSLCHGTAGSGMAMLKLYERTRDPQWLERAQAFAMHAIDQHKQEAQEAGQLRYSLWTGDLGLALFLHDTLKGSASMPGIDFF